MKMKYTFLMLVQMPLLLFSQIDRLEDINEKRLFSTKYCTKAQLNAIFKTAKINSVDNLCPTTNPIDSSCYIYCTEEFTVLNLPVPNPYAPVTCKEDGWRYYQITQQKYIEIDKNKRMFTCRTVTVADNYCPLNLDKKVLAAKFPFTGLGPDFDFVVECVKDLTKKMVVICDNKNSLLVKTSKVKFNSTCSRSFCKEDCVLENLLRLLSKNESCSCTKPLHNFGTTCSIWCNTNRQIFDLDLPVVTQIATCRGVWNVYRNANYVAVTSKNLGRCVDVTSKHEVCSVAEIDHDIVRLSILAWGFTSSEAPTSVCVTSANTDIPMECRKDVIFVRSTRLKYLDVYRRRCKSPCLTANLTSAIMDRNLFSLCRDNQYPFGGKCVARCFFGTLLDSDLRSTEAELICNGEWDYLFSKVLGTLKPVTDPRFRCSHYEICFGHPYMAPNVDMNSVLNCFDAIKNSICYILCQKNFHIIGNNPTCVIQSLTGIYRWTSDYSCQINEPIEKDANHRIYMIYVMCGLAGSTGVIASIVRLIKSNTDWFYEEDDSFYNFSKENLISSFE